MAPTVEMTPERVAKCVHLLNGLFDQIEHDFLPKVASAQSVQTTTQWSDAPPALQFQQAISVALAQAEVRLTTMWADVRGLCETLEQNAADLAAVDQTTADSLAALLKRSETEPKAPEYVDAPGYAPDGYTIPATDSSAPAGAGSSSPVGTYDQR